MAHQHASPRGADSQREARSNWPSSREMHARPSFELTHADETHSSKSVSSDNRRQAEHHPTQPLHHQGIDKPKPAKLPIAQPDPICSRGSYSITNQEASPANPNEFYQRSPRTTKARQGSSKLGQWGIRGYSTGSSQRQIRNMQVPRMTGKYRKKYTGLEMEKLLLGKDSSESNLLSKPPDGGTVAWLHALAGLFVTFNCWGLNTAFGAFQAYYTFDMLPGTTPERISWIGSIQLFLMFFLGIPVGLAMNCGLFRFLFHGGTILLIGSLLLTGFCSSWWTLFLIQGVYTGLAMGMIFCSGTILLMSYFKEKIGLAMALCATGSSLGAICYSIVIRYTIYRIGFARTMQLVAFITLATMAVANVIVRPGQSIQTHRQVFRSKTFMDVSYWVMITGLFCSFLGLFFGFVYIVSFGIQRVHMTGQESINLLIVVSATNLPGRLVIGFVSDRYTGPLNMLIPSCVLSALVMFAWTGSHSSGSLFVVASFYGLCSAGIQVLWTPTIHSFCDANPETMGIESGTAFTIISIACLIGTPIGGALVSAQHGGFLGAQLFAGSCLMLGAALLLLARYLKVGMGVCRA